jgi:cell division protein FtsZ
MVVPRKKSLEGNTESARREPSLLKSNAPNILVIGIGGAGGNAVNNVIRNELCGVRFAAANTDAQSLRTNAADVQLQIGRAVTSGLGAGGRPATGRDAAEESVAEIRAAMAGADLVFLLAGMGGGTGTGAAPVIAREARTAGILTVGIVSKPFQFEGAKRMRIAESGITELEAVVDTLIVVPNQNLFRVANEQTTFADAFRAADEVLYDGVKGISDLMTSPGLINLDFADVRTIMSGSGRAMMGSGEASGERRAVVAAETAITNPLIEDVALQAAQGVLITITGGRDMTLFEVDEAANRIRQEVAESANIIFGSTFDERLEGRMRISVVATGVRHRDATSWCAAEHEGQADPRERPMPPLLIRDARPAALTVAPKPAPTRTLVAAAPLSSEPDKRISVPPITAGSLGGQAMATYRSAHAASEQVPRAIFAGSRPWQRRET